MRALLSPYTVGVALVAAAVGDPLVETLADAGLFGPGYADTDHAGVAPAITVALLFFAVFLAIRTVGLFRAPAATNNGPARVIAAPRIEPLRVLPLQFVGVYGIECFEAVTAHQPVPVGVSWLGGPVPVSLAVHFVIAALACAVLRCVMRWLLGGLVAVVGIAAAIVARVLRVPVIARPLLQRWSSLIARAQAPHVHQVGGRAPPRPLASV